MAQPQRLSAREALALAHGEGHRGGGGGGGGRELAGALRFRVDHRARLAAFFLGERASGGGGDGSGGGAAELRLLMCPLPPLAWFAAGSCEVVITRWKLIKADGDGEGSTTGVYAEVSSMHLLEAPGNAQ